MRLPQGMSEAHWRSLERLREEVRFRVLERAALIQEATGCSWEEADRAAFEQETRRR